MTKIIELKIEKDVVYLLQDMEKVGAALVENIDEIEDAFDAVFHGGLRINSAKMLINKLLLIDGEGFDIWVDEALAYAKEHLTFPFYLFGE